MTLNIWRKKRICKGLTSPFTATLAVIDAFVGFANTPVEARFKIASRYSRVVRKIRYSPYVIVVWRSVNLE